MRYLLDTHAFLWWITDDPRLSPVARSIIGDPENRVLFSAASAWEIAIKRQIGRLSFVADPAVLISRQVAANAFGSLPIEVRHTLQVIQLPLHHRDPFDRILVAQSRIEGIALLTADPLIAQYDVATVW